MVLNQKFEQFFLKIYKDRWEKIWKALNEPVKYTQRPNKFKLDLFGQQGAENNLSEFYKMDPASILVAQALNVQPGERVLDMCAAPGGKTLILAEALDGSGELISNEISKDRRERLMRVIHEYIPKEKRSQIFVKGLDGNKYGLHSPEHFDAVLCDAPCSGERHLIENPKEFSLWTEKRSQNLAIRQFSLLSSAWLTCQNEGRLVYSTCSISPYENDEVVKKLVKRRNVQVSRDESLQQFSYIEKTEFGYQILPDTCNFGPMYFSIMTKV